MRRFVILLVTALCASLLGVVAVPTAARADVVDEGALLPGVPTTINVLAGGADVHTFTVEVPAHTRPTITVTALTEGSLVQIQQVQLSGFRFGNFLGSDPTTWYADLNDNPNDGPVTDTLQVFAFDADATLTFTLGFGADVTTPIVPNTPTTVSVDHPGDRALLTFDAGAQDVVTVRVADSTLAPPAPRPAGTPAFGLFFTFPFGDGPPLVDTSPAASDPLTLFGDGPFTLALDPAFDATGTITVTVEVTPGTVGQLSYGQGSGATFDRPNRTRRFSLTTQSAAPTLVRLFNPELVTAAGTPGSATFTLTLAGQTAPVATGTISDQSVVTVPAGTLPEGADAILAVQADSATTGSVGISVQLDPGPSTPLAVGSANEVSLPVGATRSRYSVQAAKGQTFELYLSGISFTDPTFLGSARVVVETPFGFPSGVEQQLTTFGDRSVLAFTATVAGTWVVELARPEFEPSTDVGVTASLLPVERVTTTVDRAVPLDETFAVDRAGGVVDVRLPVRAGQRFGVHVLDGAWAGPPTTFGEPPSARLSLLTDDPDLPFADIGGQAVAGLFLESPEFRNDGTMTLRLDADEQGTGSARIVVEEITDTSGVLAAEGAPTPVTVSQPGSKAVYTFEGTAGDLFALDVTSVTLDRTSGSVAIQIQGPDGSFGSAAVETGSTAWIEVIPQLTSPDRLPRLSATGTYRVTIDPEGDATGTVTVVRTRQRLVTGTIASGTSRTLTFGRGDVQRLTFAGRAGQRPVLQFSGSTVPSGVLLLDPQGNAAAELPETDGAGPQEFFGLGGGSVLPTTGTWTLQFDPLGAETGSLTVRLDLVTDPVRAVEAGRTVTATWGFAQNPVYRFKVKAGERVAVDVRSANLDRERVTLLLRNERGETVVVDGVEEVDQFQAPPRWLEDGTAASADGTWSLVLDPSFTTAPPRPGPSGSVTFVVRTAKDQVVSGRLGKPTVVAVDKPPQNVRLPFTVNPDPRHFEQFLRYDVTGSTFAGLRLTLLDANGSFRGRAEVPPGASSGTIPFFSPGFAETWTLVADPVDGATGKARLTFTVGAAP